MVLDERSLALNTLHSRMHACRACLDAGYKIFPRAIFSGRLGARLMVIGQDKLRFDALPYTIQDLAGAGHLDALYPRDEVILHLDGWHMGVGGDDGWLSQVHEEFKIYPGVYRYAFTLKPLTPQDDPSAVARTKVEGGF